MNTYHVPMWRVEESRDFGATWQKLTNTVQTSFPDRETAQQWCFDYYDALNGLGVKPDGFMLRVVAPKARKNGGK